jgi:hypothetical protein
VRNEEDSGDPPAEQGKPDEGTAPSEGQEPPQAVDDDADTLDQKLLDQNASVINNFWATVDGAGANFGAGGRRSSRAAVGRLSGEEIDSLLRHFVRPPCFGAVVRVLRTRHVVVLCGTEESGRWTGAVAALAEMGVAAGGIWMYSPSMPLAELLATKPFRAGRAYLLHDWIISGADAAVRRFEIAALVRAVAEADAYLAVTIRRAASHRPYDEVEVDWRAPDPGALFDAHVREVTFPADEHESVTRLRLRAVELHAPGRVSALARRVALREETPSTILHEVEDAVVSTWFAVPPKRIDVLTVCAVAFAHGVPERAFERLLAELITIWDRFGADRGLDIRRPDDEHLPQTRAMWSRQHPLITVVTDRDAGFTAERRVVFKREQYREQVISALVDHYGYALWEPLREWTRGLANDHVDVRFQAAVGIALLARAAPQEVMESFLDPWAAGLMFERLAAANVLALMSFEDEFAPMVLDLVLSWVRNAGQEKAMTAAMAFANGIWIRYPTDALDWLWFLTLRAVRISAVARRSLVLLFRQAAEHGEVIMALRLLVALVDEEVSVRQGTRRTRTALGSVIDILSAESLDFAEPLPARLLTSFPQSVGPLGRLWAASLAGNAHRAEAVRALRRTLRAIEGRDEAMSLATALGEAVWRAVPADWMGIVERDLRRGLMERGDGVESRLARELVQALLAAGGR